jgi:8-oxo-dGTP diphosphatase
MDDYVLDPADFSARATVVGAFLEYNGKFITLRRHEKSKYAPNEWGLPGGKGEPGETKEQTVSREVLEETSIALPPTAFTHCQTLRIRHYGADIIFEAYCATLSEEPHVQLNPYDHSDWKLVTPQEALKLSLVSGNDILVKKKYSL